MNDYHSLCGISLASVKTRLSIGQTLNKERDMNVDFVFELDIVNYDFLIEVSYLRVKSKDGCRNDIVHPNHQGYEPGTKHYLSHILKHTIPSKD